MKQIDNFPYWIDEFGNVFNKKGLKLKPFTSNKGYSMVKLFISKGIRKWIYPHIYVAKFWVENPDNKPQVDHKDTDKSNNHYTNLEWVTNQENRDRALVNGLHYHKLSNEDVIWIRENYIPYNKEFGFTALSKKFNVSHPTIKKIVSKQSYRHL